MPEVPSFTISFVFNRSDMFSPVLTPLTKNWHKLSGQPNISKFHSASQCQKSFWNCLICIGKNLNSSKASTVYFGESSYKISDNYNCVFYEKLITMLKASFPGDEN